MNITPMKPEELLGEVEDICRTMPPRETLRHPYDENYGWFGRVAAFVEAWDLSKMLIVGPALDQAHHRQAVEADAGIRKLLTVLHQARHDLRMKTLGPLNVALGAGQTFDYFDELRQIIEPATQDLFFVDAWLDAEFVSRYLPHVKAGVTVRMLASANYCRWHP